MAMLPAKDAREVLFKLLAAQFLHLQEVSKAADHAPYHTFYLFTVDLGQVYVSLWPRNDDVAAHPIYTCSNRKLANEAVKIMKNLKMREVFELSQLEEDRDQEPDSTLLELLIAWPCRPLNHPP